VLRRRPRRFSPSFAVSCIVFTGPAFNRDACADLHHAQRRGVSAPSVYVYLT
jgi:hypothetical protein